MQASRGLGLVGVFAFIVVILGTMTLNGTLCIAGASIGIVALVVHLIRRL